MKNENGVLRRPSERLLERSTQKRPVLAVGLLTILMIVSYIFILKTYEPVKNILVSGSILVYPFTFLVLAYISKYYGFKEARKSIYISSGLFVIFIFAIMVCLLPNANSVTASHNTVVQYLFAGEFIKIGGLTIFYPLLGQFFGFLVAYIISHLLYSTIYNAINASTADALSMGLSIFIATIIDRLVFMPLLNIKDLLKGSTTFDFFVTGLTSEFIFSIVAAVIMIIIYAIIISIKSHKSKKASSK